MSCLTMYTRLSLPAILLGLSAVAATGSLRAQSATAPKVFHACYVPSSGTTYRIAAAAACAERRCDARGRRAARRDSFRMTVATSLAG